MKRLFFILLVILIISLSSCRQGGLSPKLYSSAFVCEYSFASGEKLYRLRLEADGIEEGKEHRNARLYYLEPDTLSGIVCEYINGEYKAVCGCGSVNIGGDSAGALFESAVPLMSVGRIEFVGREEINGEYAEHYMVSSGDALSSVYIDGKRGKPVLVKSNVGGRELEIFIISFEEG